jgi:hypothetical protein
MFVGARQLLHSVNVQASFVRKRRRPDIGRAYVVRDIGQFVDEDRNLSQHAHVRDDFHSKLKLQGRDQGREVAVADSFAVPVDRSLRLNGAFVEGGKSIGDAEAGVA